MSIDAKLALTYGIRAPEMPPEPTISPNEAAKIFNVTGEAVKVWIYTGKLPAAKQANGYWRIRKSDLEAFMRRRVEGVRKKIMIVVSERWREVVVKAADSAGLETLIPQNRADALLKAIVSPPSLIVLDIDVPERFDFLAAVRERWSAWRAPAILIGSRGQTDAELNLAMQHGVAGFLCDPPLEYLAYELGRMLT